MKTTNTKTLTALHNAAIAHGWKVAFRAPSGWVTYKAVGCYVPKMNTKTGAYCVHFEILAADKGIAC